MILRDLFDCPGTIVRNTGEDVCFTEISLYPDSTLDQEIRVGQPSCQRGESIIWFLNPMHDSGLRFYAVGQLFYGRR